MFLKIISKIFFRLRFQFALRPLLRKLWWQMQGAQFGTGTSVPRLLITWLHQVSIGARCNLESGIFFKYDGYWQPGPSIIDHDHELTVGIGPMHSLSCPEAAITLEPDVWLGVNVVVLKGVTIGQGAVVGAGAVVTKSVPPYEIWAGIPAKKIGQRLEQEPVAGAAARVEAIS